MAKEGGGGKKKGTYLRFYLKGRRGKRGKERKKKKKGGEKNRAPLAT